jgi:acyl-coenzyme A thioesterase PaaI-like protein
VEITPKDLIGANAASDGWFGIGEIDRDVADGFAEVVAKLREVQDLVATVAPTEQASRAASALLDDVLATLTPHEAAENAHLVGRLLDIPGRGQALVPAHTIDSFDGVRLTARITYNRFYRGGNGAVHGGAIPLLFDELMGWTAAYGRERLRTAFLHVNFRSPAMVGRELRITTWIDREEGRKLFIGGTLDDGETRVADVEGLWVKLRPGQV